MPNTRIPKTALLLAVVALYSLAHLTWYLDTPLGIKPVLDGQENLILAQQIQDGSLAREPFYRAMLYPALLAVLSIGHSLLGLLCHLANTTLAARLARRFWQDERSGLISGALVGLNPVLLHFAFDPLDTTLAITLFLATLTVLQTALQPDAGSNRCGLLLASAGALISLTALARPHFLLTLAVLSVLLLWATLRKRISKTHFASYAAACILPLLAFGLVQKSWSGSFQILPWQGAYNLWISNNPKANGLYYQQSVSFHHLEQHQNPNRMEAALLYEQAHGHLGTISEQTAYWRTRTLSHVTSEPLAWLKLEAFKLYATLNNFEQYNNKTYAFHKQLSPWLRYNPIGWGLLLALATFCAATLWRQKRSELLPLLAISSSLVAGLLIYMASARFRLPLTPLLAIVAGGLPLAWAAFSSSSSKLKRNALIATAAALAIAFTRFAGVASEKTFPQDALLIADAAAQIGDDDTAIKWSSYALEKIPNQQQGLRLRLISRYNQIASGERAGTESEWRKLYEDNQSLELQDELLSFIRGVVFWNLDQKEAAQKEWQSGYATFGPRASACLAALTLTGSPIPFEELPAPLESYLVKGNHSLLAYAIATNKGEETRQHFLAAIGLSNAAFHSIGASMKRIIPRE